MHSLNKTPAHFRVTGNTTREERFGIPLLSVGLSFATRSVYQDDDEASLAAAAAEVRRLIYG